MPTDLDDPAFTSENPDYLDQVIDFFTGLLNPIMSFFGIKDPYDLPGVTGEYKNGKLEPLVPITETPVLKPPYLQNDLLGMIDKAQVFIGSAIMVPFVVSAAMHYERLRQAYKVGPPRGSTPAQKRSFKIWKRKQILRIRDESYKDLAGLMRDISLKFCENPYAQGLVLYASADHMEKLGIIDSTMATALKASAETYMGIKAAGDVLSFLKGLMPAK